MEKEMIAIGAGEPFRFSCFKGISCFGVCCRDLNQFLTPYDILRIKNRLDISSTRFLEQFTLSHIGPRSGLPIVAFRTGDGPDFTCPFLTSGGCGIYEDRPTSCRLYPLARAVSRSRETGKASYHFALIREPFCQGFENDVEWTARKWIEGQDAAGHIRMNDCLLDLIAFKNRFYPGPLTLKHQNIFSTALYDLDRFKAEAEKGLLEDFPMEPGILEAALTDDAALLELGHRWVANVLAEPLGRDLNA